VYAPIFHFGAIVVNSCEKTWNFSMVIEKFWRKTFISVDY
jgi:hypothetical protein